MTDLIRRTGFAILVLTIAAAAQAKDGPEWAVCRQDKAKFCASVEEGEGKVSKCMEKHRKELSAACRAQLDKSKAASKPAEEKLPEECRADGDKLCHDVTPGESRLITCIHAHYNELTPECQKASKMVVQVQPGRTRNPPDSEVKKSCAAEAAKACKGEAAGEKLDDCLRAHRDDLGQACRNILMGPSEEAAPKQ